MAPVGREAYRADPRSVVVLLQSMSMGNTAQPDVTTRLAFDRTRVAFDRTVMAWIRTATALITFGFSIYKFFQIEVGHKPDHHPIGPREFALTMVGIGLASLLLGVVDHRQKHEIANTAIP